MVLFLGDVAGSEVLLILLFVLMFFGSKSIPSIARTLGRTMRQIKDASQDLQDEIRKTTHDIKGDMNLSSFVNETAREIQQPFEEYASDLDESIKFSPNKPQAIEKPVEELVKDKPIIDKSSLPLDQQHLEE
jgi:sec-independent protein translocase protein TatA